ncbi:MAG: hypothetical protein K8T26_01905 [Lentisphaerae bacterium]|nr:hypothetical protein [Lentisphaerota bacterium]
MSVQVDIGGWLTKGLDLYKRNFGLLVVASLLAMLLSAVTFGILAGPMFAGLILIALRLLRGAEPKPAVGTLFEGFNHFAQSFLFMLVWGLICIVAGTVLSLIPCIGQAVLIVGSLALSTLLMFAMFLIVDRGMAFWPASMASLEAVKPAFWPLLGFSVIAQIVSQLGAIACGIGIVFTLPIGVCAMAIAYETFIVQGGTPDPATPPVDAPPPPLA